MARDTGKIAAALRQWLPGGQRITGVTVLSAGHSNETYLIEGVNLVLRLPPSEAGLLPPYDMVKQHQVIKAVGEWTAGPPVPRVYELCTDKSVLGDDFFVMERIDGGAFEYSVPDWLAQAPPATARSMSEQWIGAVAALHRMPAERMPAEAISPKGLAQHWLDVANEAQGDPRLVEILEDLVRRPPASSGPPTPVHGDPKQGNNLWNGPRLAALVDWEMAHVGEPLGDLGYLLSYYGQPLGSAGLDLPGWLTEAEMTAAWEQATGRKAADIGRYQVLGMAKLGAIITMGYHMFLTGQITDPRFDGFGKVLPDFLKVLFRRAEVA
jgi:aminoglycoside phosphotransferase (APT) family kinase protein